MKTVGEIAQILREREEDFSDLVADLSEQQARTDQMHDLLDELNIPQVLERDEDGLSTTAVGRLRILCNEVKDHRQASEERARAALECPCSCPIPEFEPEREVIGFFVKRDGKYLQVRKGTPGPHPRTVWDSRYAAFLYPEKEDAEYEVGMLIHEGVMDARIVKVTRAKK